MLDASATLAWAFRDEATAESDDLFARVSRVGAVVPALWFFEVANVLTRAVRQSRVTAAQMGVFLDLLDGLSLEVARVDRMQHIRRTVNRANAAGITAYDAAYLDLASARHLPLATLDRRLRRSASEAGIAVYPDSTTTTNAPQPR